MGAAACLRDGRDVFGNPHRPLPYSVVRSPLQMPLWQNRADSLLPPAEDRRRSVKCTLPPLAVGLVSSSLGMFFTCCEPTRLRVKSPMTQSWNTPGLFRAVFLYYLWGPVLRSWPVGAALAAASFRTA